MEYSIGEAAKMLDVSPQSIRNWERQGYIPKVCRSSTNQRKYEVSDIEIIRQHVKNKYNEN